MSANFCDLVKQGYAKIKSRKLGLWQRRWLVLRRHSSKGPKRLEKYIDEKDSHIKQCEKVIRLNAVETVSRIPADIKKYGLVILFKDNSIRQFCCESEMDINEWLSALKKECISTLHSIDLINSGQSEQEENDICHVYLLPNPNLEIYGECLLQVTTENINLLNAEELQNRLVTWPLSALRKYGADESKFTFESGRFCDTGEGLFVLNTVEADRVYQKVNSASRLLADAVRTAQKKVPRHQSQQGELQRSETLPTRVAERPHPRLIHSSSDPGGATSATFGHGLPQSRMTYTRPGDRQRALPPTPIHEEDDDYELLPQAPPPPVSRTQITTTNVSSINNNESDKDDDL